MSTCEGCIAALDHPRSGLYIRGCTNCSARAIAGEPEFFESSSAEAITPKYRDRLLAVFGLEWKQGHEAVKTWAQKLKGTP